MELRATSHGEPAPTRDGARPPRAGSGAPCTLPRCPYLGGARVTRVDRGGVAVELPGGGSAWAALALFIPYQPARGDELLLLGDHRQLYAIGVLERTKGSWLTTAAGSLGLRAREGRLRLVGDHGVRLEGKQLRLHATEGLQLLAWHTVERLGELQRTVEQTWTVLAEDLDEQSSGSWLTRARSALLAVRKTYRVDGRSIRVG